MCWQGTKQFICKTFGTRNFSYIHCTYTKSIHSLCSREGSTTLTPRPGHELIHVVPYCQLSAPKPIMHFAFHTYLLIYSMSSTQRLRYVLALQLSSAYKIVFNVVHIIMYGTSTCSASLFSSTITLSLFISALLNAWVLQSHSTHEVWMSIML